MNYNSNENNYFDTAEKRPLSHLSKETKMYFSTTSEIYYAVMKMLFIPCILEMEMSIF